MEGPKNQGSFGLCFDREQSSQESPKIRLSVYTVVHPRQMLDSFGSFFMISVGMLGQ